MMKQLENYIIERISNATSLLNISKINAQLNDKINSLYSMNEITLDELKDLQDYISKCVNAAIS